MLFPDTPNIVNGLTIEYHLSLSLFVELPLSVCVSVSVPVSLCTQERFYWMMILLFLSEIQCTVEVHARKSSHHIHLELATGDSVHAEVI